MDPVRTVEVNPDGTVDAEQLAALPAEIASQLASVDLRPYLKIRQRTGRRESKRKPIRTFHVEQFVGDQAHNLGKDRKHAGLSARQYKRAQRAARQLAHAKMRGELI